RFGRRARCSARLRLARRRRRDGGPGQAPGDAAHRARGRPAARAADRSSAAAGAGSPARLAGLGAERKAETVTEISVLQLVSPPRQVPELIAALRAWEPGTADEKLPYAVLNLATLPLPGVIVYGGGGFHQGALHWLCANTRATDISRLGDWLTVFFAL